jgi:hypothetical protein
MGRQIGQINSNVRHILVQSDLDQNQESLEYQKIRKILIICLQHIKQTKNAKFWTIVCLIVSKVVAGHDDLLTQSRYI